MPVLHPVSNCRSCTILVVTVVVALGALPTKSFITRTKCRAARWYHSTPLSRNNLGSFVELRLGIDESYDDDDDEDILSDEELAASMGEWDDKIARFNTVHLTGRIGNDPEPRYFDDGKVVVNLSLATKRKYHFMERKARNIPSGEEETDWYGLEIWGQTAEFASRYVEKGAKVSVVGSLQVDQWTDKATGEPRSRAKVIVRDLDILETKAQADMRRTNQRGPSFYLDNEGDEDYFGGSSSQRSSGFFN